MERSLPYPQKDLPHHVEDGRNANHHDDSIPEVCGILVGDDLQDHVVQDLLLEIVRLGEVGKVYARVVQRGQGHG